MENGFLMTDCYECKNYNHVDCTVRVGRHGANCDCWCLGDKNYRVQLPSKKARVMKFA